MLTITKPSDNRVDIELRGSLDADMMRKGLEDLLSMSEGVTNGTMLYTIPEFALPTLEALGVELTMLPKMFGLLGKYDKCAVLTDAGWIRTAAEVEGVLMPGLTIKAFPLDGTAAAEAWLAA
ncbi:STAS/SEC14 domain-containing protein [Sulfitobacter mediterraneus]|jgi:hypothetical protein|uniref:STAS/SEC14 domain-containing protein n=1 Tax=Sulfitobacter mediterraneus TaxID=83219 RepID=UPI000EA2E655|nr:STAS/SEC14 domain-containing protein [Sulfitobacter mediterraneus]